MLVTMSPALTLDLLKVWRPAALQIPLNLIQAQNQKNILISETHVARSEKLNPF